MIDELTGLDIWDIDTCRKVRKMLNITPGQMSNYLGVTRQTLYNLEAQTTRVGKPHLIAYTLILKELMKEEGYNDIEELKEYYLAHAIEDL